MRSQLVFDAMKHVSNRYLLTRVAAKAIRGLHRPNTRIAETANDVLVRFALKDPLVSKLSDPRCEQLELRRAS